MTGAAQGGITLQISALMGQLPDALRRVGQLVLDDPRGVAELSIAEIAARANTSQATVTRFCRMTGVASYRHLRLALAREQGSADAGLWQEEIGSTIEVDDSLATIGAVIARSDTAAIQATVDRVDFAAVEQVAQAVASARRVEVYGIVGSGMVAQALHTRLHRIGCAAWVWTESHAGETSAALLTPADVAIGFSHSGSTQEIVRCLEAARDAGATTVAVTNGARSPLARVARHLLLTAVYETTFRSGSLAAMHSQLVVADLLYVRVAQLTYDRAALSLARTAHVHPDHFVRRDAR
jgi:DNA-binding MurR/RpiR family transcriptional regulator